ncbi:B-cell receptor CD22-like [Ptychodera flava]|uniref:B-cell receptor CD22-like n=1 Tax=Ptychodera flava TaxID=63121 RepID=UPI00396A5CBD
MVFATTTNATLKICLQGQLHWHRLSTVAVPCFVHAHDCNDGPAFEGYAVQLGSTARHCQTLRLSVFANPPTIRTPPSAAIKEGAKVTLNCTVVEANPMTVNFIWELNDGTTFTEPIVDLYGVTREFTGIHTCTDGPEISFDTKEVICKEGESVTLQCTVDANPAPYDVHWMSGGQRIYDGTTYPLASANRSDEGTLVCMAHNRFYDNSTAMGQESLELFVQCKPAVTTEVYGTFNYSGDSVVVLEGAPLSVGCMVTEANPAVDAISWSGGSANADGAWLNFTEISRDHGGYYTCQAKNTFWDLSVGSADVTINIEVQCK